MVSKVRVYGKAQNRTALGIINAYLVMYPHATLDDVKKAFPNELNPDSGSKEIILEEGEIQKRVASGDEWYVKGQAYFAEEDEWLVFADKSRAAVVRMWTKPSFERLMEHAKQYGIEIAEFERGMKGQKGGFRLEYLNGWVPPTPIVEVEKVVEKEVIKKHIPAWVWIVLGLLVAGLIALFMMKGCNKDTQVVTIVDTVYVQQLEDIEDHFNAAKFEKGDATLSDDAKFVLHDLQKLMDKNPDMKLRIVGHTSEEGDADFNQKLSEDRAKAAVDFLVSQGIAESRLQYEGKGSSEPLEPGNNEKNRRTEFEIIDK